MRLIKPRIWREAASLILIARSKELSSLKLSQVPPIIRPYISSEMNDVLFRDYNYKILVMKRGKSVKFMPNTSAFPGGGLSACDFSPKWLDLFQAAGLSENDLLRPWNNKNRLKPLVFQDVPEFDKLNGEDHGPSLAPEIAFRICAVRETFEECGILLARPLETYVECPKFAPTFRFASKDLQSSWQKKVLEDGENFFDLCKKENLCPDIRALYEWSNWLTPVAKLPIRYDTIFFMTFVDHLPDVQLGDDELVHFQYSTPAEVLSSYIANEVVHFMPQFYEVSQLVKFHEIKSLMSFAKQRDQYGSECRLCVVVKAIDGEIFLMPGDSAYPKEPDFAGISPILKTNLSIKESRQQATYLHRGEFQKSKPLIIHCNIELPAKQMTPISLNCIES